MYFRVDKLYNIKLYSFFIFNLLGVVLGWLQKNIT